MVEAWERRNRFPLAYWETAAILTVDNDELRALSKKTDKDAADFQSIGDRDIVQHMIARGATVVRREPT